MEALEAVVFRTRFLGADFFVVFLVATGDVLTFVVTLEFEVAGTVVNALSTLLGLGDGEV